MSMNQFFNYLEKSILVVILISTVVAFATVILGLFEAGTVELADILLLFILFIFVFTICYFSYSIT